MKRFAVRGIEFHSSRLWQWKQVENALNFMEKFGLNTLIFHQNDLIDQLVFPEPYFSDDLMWERWPVRMHTIYQNRHYINKVIQEASLKGIDLYLEVKEISFVDEMLELVPQVRNADGSICPTDPFWWDFLTIKMKELLGAVPGLAGIIVSPGTRESKVSLSANTCKCERCENTDPIEWYTKLLSAMHDPLAEVGKTLAVRDFSYTADHQSTMIQAAARCSKDIVISLKNTPHDFYPTFPHNPKIGNTDGLRQWIEIDTWGQFFGLGFFPTSVVEDMQYRIRHARECGAEGINLRTDWEVITDAGAFNSMNMLNVVAGAMLSGNPDIQLDDIYETWVKGGIISAMKTASELPVAEIPTGENAVSMLREFMKASWKVMEKSVYVRGHLFHEDGQIPDTVKKAYAMMVDIHGRDEWEPGASEKVQATDENIAIIFQEKDEAMREVKALSDILRPDELGVSPQMAEELKQMLDLYVWYVKGYELTARAVFPAKKYEMTGDEKDAELARKAIEPLKKYRKELIERLKGTSYPHYVYWLLDERRVQLLVNDLEKRLNT